MSKLTVLDQCAMGCYGYDKEIESLHMEALPIAANFETKQRGGGGRGRSDRVCSYADAKRYYRGLHAA